MATNIKVLKHKDFKEVFSDSTYDNGTETLKLTLWEDFKKVVEIFSESKERFIWRGQRKDWQLKSTFDRHPCYNRLTLLDESGEIRENILKILLINFKEKLDQSYKEWLRNDIDLILKDESGSLIWIIGQHFGLPTPILDWTKCPYIAAYFAFHKNCKNEQCNRIVYALNIRALKLLLDGEKQKFVKYINLKENDFYGGLKDRIIKQKSKFTEALNGTDIETNVKMFWEVDDKKNKKYSDKVILAKIIIPNKYPDKFLEFLESNDITYVKLFTDYRGAVDICKIDLGLEEYEESPA